MTAKTTSPSGAVDGLKAAAHLLNRQDLRAADEREARSFNAAEKAVRDGIALIEDPRPLFEAAPLVWGLDKVSGYTLTVGRGLGLKYHVSEKLDGTGWCWTVGEGANPVEPTEEAARAACQANFTEKLRAATRPLCAAE